MGNFDKVLEAVNPWGRYQKLRFFLLCLPAAYGAFGFGVAIFNIMPQTHWCKLPPSTKLPENLRGLSKQELQKLLIPKEEVFPGFMGLSRCSIRDPRNQSGSEIPCPNGWEYDENAKWTLISEWDLVCSQDYIGSLILTVNSVGAIIGTFIFSILQDTLGRKLSLFIALPWSIFWSCMTTLVPSVWAFIGVGITKALVGMALFQVPYVLALEMVGPKQHTIVINVMSIIFSTAMAFTALLAYLCQTWRQLIVSANGPAIFLMFLWFLVDESPRWLVSKGRYEEANKIIQKMAKINKLYVPKDEINQLIQETEKENPADTSEERKANFLTMWKHLNMAVMALVLAFLWSVNAMVYVGLSFNTQNFGGNVFLVFALLSLVEIPAAIFNFIVDYVGRIWPTFITMSLSGLALLAASATPPQINWVVILLAVISKFCITSSFCILYQIGGEVFPTILRGTGIGFATMISQILSIVTPFIVYSSTALHILPMLILGGLSILGGLVTLFLPETLNRHLPEFVEDTKKVTGFGCKAFMGNITFRSLRNQRKKK